MKAFFLFLWLFILLIVSPVWGGYVLSVMWAWFVVPTFHLPQVSIAVAIGLSMLIHMLTYTGREEDKKEASTSDAVISSFCTGFLYPLAVLAIGYCVHLFV